MSRYVKIIGALGLLLASLFVSVGYAAVTGDLQIGGSVEYDQNIPPIEIVAAEMVKGTGNTLAYSAQMLSSRIILENGEAVVAITVRNNTDISTDHIEETYGYNSVTRYEIDGYVYNKNVEYHLYTDESCQTPIEKGGEIINTSTGESTLKGFTLDPGTEGQKTFYVKFSFIEGADTITSEVDSYLSFNFMPLEEIYEDADDEALNNALNQFRKILNNEVKLSDGTTQSFNYLTSQMDKASTNDRSLTDYIGNVNGASKDDKEVIAELFQGELNVNIDGQDKQVTFLIKYDDVYSAAAGDEMTIYMTTENLNEKESTVKGGFMGFGATYTPSYSEVYACTFVATTDREGNKVWVQLTDDIIKGTAIVCDYDGGMQYVMGKGNVATGSGSFRTDDWRAEDGKTISQTISGIPLPRISE